MTPTVAGIDELCIDTIRTLSIDAVESMMQDNVFVAS